MSEKKVGIRFNLTSAEKAPAKFRAIGGAAGKARKDVQHMTRGMNSSFRSFTGSLGSFKTQILGTLGAIGAGMATWKFATLRENISREMNKLRGLDLPEDVIERAEEFSRKFSNAFAGTTKKELVDALYDANSAMSGMSEEAVRHAMEVSAKTGKTIIMHTKEAVDMMMGIWTSTRPFFKEMSSDEFFESWGAKMWKAVQLAHTVGPKMREALSKAAPSMAQLGWNQEQMLAPIAQLMGTARPEEIGTMLGNFAQRARTGLASVIAQADVTRKLGAKVWEAAPAKIKKNWIKNIEEQIDRTKFLAKGPVEILKTLKKNLKAIGSEGEQQALLKALFQEDLARQLPKLLADLEKLKNLEEQIGGAKFRDVERVHARMNKSLDEAIGRLKQRWSNMWESIPHGMESQIGGVLDWISAKFQWVSDVIEGNLGRVQEAVTAFSEHFKFAFNAAFSAAPGLERTIKGITDALEKPDPQKWADLGRQWGEFAGISLDKTVTALESIATATQSIAGVVGPIGDFVGKLQKFDNDSAAFLGKFLPEWLGYKEAKGPPKSSGSITDPSNQPDWTLGKAIQRLLFPSWFEARQKARESRVIPEENASAGPPTVAPGRPPAWAPVGAGAGPAPNVVVQPQQALPPEIENQIRVYLDSDEIAARFEDRQRFRADRLGYGYRDR